MKSLLALMRKEYMEATRTGKIMIIILLFVLFGIMSPAVAKLTPWMMKMLSDSMAESGLIVTNVQVDALTSWTQFFKNIPIALIAFVLIFSDIFTKEYKSGTLLLVLTKGLSRYKVVLAKTVLLLSIWTVGYEICFNYSIEFVVGDEVEEIGDYAFYGCTIMQTVTIGKNVKSIGSRAFSGCTNATQINFACTMEQLFDIVFGDSWISRTIAMTVGGESIGNSIEVPASVAEVRLDAFDCVSGITKIVLPADVVKILSGLNQTEGVSVYYGGTIGQWMQIEFAEPLAKSFTLYCQGTLVEEIDVPDTLLSVSDYAFYGCDGLKSVIFSENSALQSIGISAFENCANLTTVTLPVGMSQLTEIKSRAFFDCTALTEVQIPSSVVSLGDYVFRGCSSLQTVIFGAESRLTAIPDYAFNRCTSLTQIELPFGVTSIGRFAFYGDSLLASVTFSGNEGANALTTIGASAFEDCAQLTSFVLSESMANFGTDAFKGCYSLATVYNYSSLILVKGSSSYGYIACYAKEIVEKEIAV